jgi:hypothetical protein
VRLSRTIPVMVFCPNRKAGIRVKKANKRTLLIISRVIGFYI